MENNDKFIRDTPFGKLMESESMANCSKCRHFEDDDCIENTDNICIDNFIPYYFAKDEPEVKDGE